MRYSPGMGGDLIVRILSACSWRAREGLTLVLQPQSAGNVLRRWLYSEGLELLREEPVQDGSFLYTVMQAARRVSRAADARAGIRLARALTKRQPARRRVSCARRDRADCNCRGFDGRGKAAPRASCLLLAGIARNSGNEETLWRQFVKFITSYLTLPPPI